MNTQHIGESFRYLAQISPKLESAHKKSWSREILVITSDSIRTKKINVISYNIKQLFQRIFSKHVSDFEQLYSWSTHAKFNLNQQPDLLSHLDKTTVKLALENLKILKNKKGLSKKDSDFLNKTIDDVSNIQQKLDTKSQDPQFRQKQAFQVMKENFKPIRGLNNPEAVANIKHNLSNTSIHKQENLSLLNNTQVQVSEIFLKDMIRSEKIVCDKKVLFDKNIHAQNIIQLEDKEKIENNKKIEVVEKMRAELGTDVFNSLALFMHQSTSFDIVENLTHTLVEISQKKNPSENEFLNNSAPRQVPHIGNEYRITSLTDNKISLQIIAHNQIEGHGEAIGYYIHSRTITINKEDLERSLTDIKEKAMSSVTVYDESTDLHATHEEAIQAFNQRQPLVN